MNLRTFSVIGAVAMLGLGACVINTTPGTGGSGGSAGSDVGSGGTGGSAGASVSSSSGGGMGGGGGAGGGTGMCTSCCADKTIDSTVTFCMGTGDAASKTWDALAACACDPAAGKCATACGDNRCMDAAPSNECTVCITDANMGCGNELAACSNDTTNCLP